MPDTTNPDSQRTPGAGAAGASGCVVFLVDESTAMEARVASGTKSKAESVATALNSLLGQLTGGPVIDLAIVGYRTDAQGGQEIGSRWGGSLAGRRFVASAELADAPLEVQTRVRKVPGAGGVGVAREETVPFPVWYVPSLGGAASRSAAFDHCAELLSEWITSAGTGARPPMVVSFVGEPSSEESPQGLGGALGQVQAPGGPPLVIHAHLGSSDRIPATLYPSHDAHLAPGPIRSLFEACGVLPGEFCGALRQLQVRVNANARGLIYNARMGDLIRLLSLVKTYARSQPPAAAAASEGSTVTDAPTPTIVTGGAKQRALIVLLLDRSVEDPEADAAKSVWPRLQEHANELLGQIAKRGQDRIDCALVSYGSDPAGQAAVAKEFAGPLAGRDVVADTDLAGGALRVDEMTEQVSNGIGGLVSVTRKRPVFVDLAPTSAAPPAPAFAAVKELLARWRSDHAESQVAPIVVHLTRGRFTPDQTAEAVGLLGERDQFSLYHLVVTETPHAALAYPADATKIEDAGLAKLCELSSPLLESQAPAARKTVVSGESRGIVINGKFDLFWDGIEQALTTAEGGPPDAAEEPS
jgi:hypothetical protein